MKIGLISDTHSYLNPKVFEYFADCDEIWHAGDFGSDQVAYELADFKPLRAVYGNIDGGNIRKLYAKNLIFTVEGLKIFMTHIGGYPTRYDKDALKIIKSEKPNVFICGHSHILKVISDKANNNMLAINPGAAGRYGFQLVSTIITMELNNQKITNMKAIEMGK